MLIDMQAYYAKLANKEAITEGEIVQLLKELSHFRGVASYLASCHAATLESLPKSASKSSRGRHVFLCETAAKALVGDASAICCPDRMEVAIERCQRAVEANRLD